MKQCVSDRAERETDRKYDGRRGRRNGNEREGRRVKEGEEKVRRERR